MKQNVVSNFDLIENEWADPDIRLGVHINSDIRLGGDLICFPVSHVYFFVGGRPTSLAKLNGGHGQPVPPICHWKDALKYFGPGTFQLWIRVLATGRPVLDKGWASV